MKKILLPTALISIGIFAALIIAEIACRIMAIYSVEISYLTHAGLYEMPEPVNTLEQFQKSQPQQLIKYRDWRNYYTNSLGFVDTEFIEKKDPETIRIIALGDSFTYGMVAYPQNVMRLVEEELQAKCQKKIEIYNMGVGGAGVWEYLQLAKLTAQKYKPDYFLLNFYMGNDGPDLYHGIDSLPRPHKGSRHSYLYRLTINTWKIYHQLGDAQLLKNDTTKKQKPSKNTPNGGHKIDSALPEMTDQDPALTTPVFIGDGWYHVLRDEIFRFYKPKEKQISNNLGWLRLYDLLDQIKKTGAEHDTKFIISFYPSNLQINSDLQNFTISSLNQKYAENGISFNRDSFDLELPNQALNYFCQNRNLNCIDILPAFKSNFSPNQALFLPQDTHWNIAGNRLAAHAQAEAMINFICPVTRE